MLRFDPESNSITKAVGENCQRHSAFTKFVGAHLSSMGTNSWEVRKSKVDEDEMKKIMSALPRGAPPKKRQIEEKSDAVDETNFKKLKKKAKKLCNSEGCDEQTGIVECALRTEQRGSERNIERLHTFAHQTRST